MKEPGMTDRLRIGTRGSALALTQTRAAAAALQAHFPALSVEIVEIRTSGDWTPAQGETRLSAQEGGKGLFAREIEQAILDGRVDCGVHSLKDMPSFLPEGLVLDHVMTREDPRDAFIGGTREGGVYRTLDDLPAGARVGTSSMRRQAFVLARRPDLQVIPLRGNVPTRLEKLRAGQADAILLAVAGLKRLGLTDEISSVFSAAEMMPAAGQGIVGIETRAGDAPVRALFDTIHCRATGYCAAAERAALAVLDGSCHTPIGAHAVLVDHHLTLEVAVAAPDGGRLYSEKIAGAVHDTAQARGLGERAGYALKAVLPPGFLE